MSEDIVYRLRAAVIRWFKGVPIYSKKPTTYDILRRLRSDVHGPEIHPSYYRQDLIDAADEIEYLRNRIFESKVTPMSQKKGSEADKEDIERVMLGTVDPTVRVEDKPLPALSTLLLRVCDGNEAKFKEATRLVELFVANALGHG